MFQIGIFVRNQIGNKKSQTAENNLIVNGIITTFYPLCYIIHACYIFLSFRYGLMLLSKCFSRLVRASVLFLLSLAIINSITTVSSKSWYTFPLFHVSLMNVLRLYNIMGNRIISRGGGLHDKNMTFALVRNTYKHYTRVLAGWRQL